MSGIVRVCAVAGDRGVDNRQIASWRNVYSSGVLAGGIAGDCRVQYCHRAIDADSADDPRRSAVVVNRRSGKSQSCAVGDVYSRAVSHVMIIYFGVGDLGYAAANVYAAALGQ